MSLQQQATGLNVRVEGFSAAEAVGIAIGLRLKPVNVSSTRDILQIGLTTGGTRRIVIECSSAGSARCYLLTPETTLANAGASISSGAWYDVMVWVEGPRNGASRALKVWSKPRGSGSATTNSGTFTSDNTPGQVLAVVWAGGDSGDLLHDIFVADNIASAGADTLWTSFSGGTRPHDISDVDYAWDCEGANLTEVYAANKGGINLATNGTAPTFSADNPGGFGPVTFLRPDATSSAGSWLTDTGGSNLHAALDEESASDSDYIISSSSPVADVCKIQLSNFASFTPTGYTVRYRYYKQETGGPVALNLRARLLEGTTERASWTHTNIGTSPTTATQTLSAGEVAAITDATNLFLEFTANP